MPPEQENISGDDRQQALKAAVQHLYDIFGRYQLHGPVTGYPCCESGDKRVVSKPLRLLTGTDLEHFADRVLTSHATLQEFKHFLPRVLELTATQGSVGYTSAEIVLGKLGYMRPGQVEAGNWLSWPRREREAVRQFIMAWWLTVLGSLAGSPDANTSLCAIAQAENELGPYLESWQNDKGLPADRHLATFVAAESHCLFKHRRLRNAFWWGREEQMNEVIEWLLNAAVSQRLESAFFACQDREVAGELSTAVDAMDALRRFGENFSPTATK